MIEAIKYLPFKFKEGPLKPESIGPQYRLNCKAKFVYEGSVFEFLTPRNAPRSRAHADSVYTGKIELSNLQFRPLLGIPGGAKWEQIQCFARNWCYWGPWFTGEQIELSLSIVLTRKLEPLEEGLSLFNPKFLEGCLPDLLTERFGYETGTDNLAAYRAPTNWQTINTLAVPSASFWIEPIGRGYFAPLTQFIVLPVSKTTLGIFSFSYKFFKPGDYQKRKELVNIDLPKSLAEEIFRSLKITLSPKAQSDLENAKADCPGVKLTETFAPLRWPPGIEDKPINNTLSIGEG